MTAPGMAVERNMSNLIKSKVERIGSAFPTDDKPKSIKYRMDAIYNGIRPQMPKLASMTKKQMAEALQSIWTLLDETGVQRRNETSTQHHLTIYGRVYGAIRNGTQ